MRVGSDHREEPRVLGRVSPRRPVLLVSLRTRHSLSLYEPRLHLLVPFKSRTARNL